MGRNRLKPWTLLVVALALHMGNGAEAQTYYRTVPGGSAIPYGYGIANGQIAPGYQAAYQFYPRPYYYGFPRQRQTVTDYQSLINAVTSLPGWYGPAPRPARPVAPQPTIARGELINDDGTVLWPSATPSDSRVLTTRHAAEEAVRIAVQEQRKEGQATIRHVADARNKLDAFARDALPILKAKNAADSAGLERFIVELKKTLATLAVHY